MVLVEKSLLRQRNSERNTFAISYGSERGMTQATKKTGVLLLAIFISGMVMLFSDDQAALVHVFAIGLLAVSSSALVGFNLIHPLCWFAIFSFVYYCSYAVLYGLGIYVTYGYSKEPLLLEWFALSAVTLILPKDEVSYQEIASLSTSFLLPKKGNLIKVAMIGSSLYIVAALVLIETGGFSNKNAIYASGDVFIRGAFYAADFVTILYAYYLTLYLIKSGDREKIWIVIVPTIVFLFGMLTGERNYMFSIALEITLLLLAFKRITPAKVLFILGVGLLLFPLTSAYKYFFLSGGVSQFASNDYLYQMLGGEFASAGRNLQILVNNGCEGCFGVESIANEVIRCFVDTGYSCQLWFSNTFMSNPSVMYGFTIVGEGYVHGGIIGVAIVACIEGAIARLLYKASRKSIFFLTVYIYMVPIIIYASRADLANIISPLWKYALLTVLLIMIFDGGSLLSSYRESNKVR